MIWNSIVRPRALEAASVCLSAKSDFARKAAETVSDLATLVYNLVMDVRDSYRPELHYMRGPGPKWRAKHPFWPGADFGKPAAQHRTGKPRSRRNEILPATAFAPNGRAQ